MSYHLLVLRVILGNYAEYLLLHIGDLDAREHSQITIQFFLHNIDFCSHCTLNLFRQLSSTPCHPGVLKNAENGTVSTLKATVMRFHCNCLVSGTRSSALLHPYHSLLVSLG